MANESIIFKEGTDRVVNVAGEVDGIANDFFRDYTNLYNLVENELAACWKGEDYAAFKAKVTDEKHYFDSMRDVINEYATALRNAANSHEARMQDSKGQVDSNCTF